MRVSAKRHTEFSLVLAKHLGSSGTFSAGVWTSVDVTSYITGNGTYSLAFSTTSNTRHTHVSFASHELGANAPQLAIQTSGGPIGRYEPRQDNTFRPNPVASAITR